MSSTKIITFLATAHGIWWVCTPAAETWRGNCAFSRRIFIRHSPRTSTEHWQVVLPKISERILDVALRLLDFPFSCNYTKSEDLPWEILPYISNKQARDLTEKRRRRKTLPTKSLRCYFEWWRSVSHKLKNLNSFEMQHVCPPGIR